MSRLAIVAVSSAFLFSTTAYGGDDIPVPISPPGPNSESETSLFAGLNWTFGPNGNGPSARVGAIYTETDSDDDVQGARMFLDFPLDGTGGAPRFTLTGFAGSTSGVGELGLGYDFASGQFYGHAGALMSFFELGGTIGFTGGGYSGYLGLNTFEFEEVEPLESFGEQGPPGDQGQ